MTELVLEIARREYARRLACHGVPAAPVGRTPEQATLAASLFWAVSLELASLSILTQAALEGE